MLYTDVIDFLNNSYINIRKNSSEKFLSSSVNDAAALWIRSSYKFPGLRASRLLREHKVRAKSKSPSSFGSRSVLNLQLFWRIRRGGIRAIFLSHRFRASLKIRFKYQWLAGWFIFWSFGMNTSKKKKKYRW